MAWVSVHIIKALGNSTVTYYLLSGGKVSERLNLI